jgi:peptide/nickel transport system substrate-binding protein
VRLTKKTSLQLSAAVSCLVLVVAGCGSSSKPSTTPITESGNAPRGSTPPTTGSSLAGTVTGAQITANNNSGTPVTGGTLTVLGASDVTAALDPNLGYFTTDYQAYELYERSLYTYPSVQGSTFEVAPDLATATPTVTDGGLKYAVTIRTGAMWNTSPPRQVTAADELLGVKRSCNPTYPFGGQPDFSDILVGYTTFCNGFAKVSATSAPAQAAYINSHNIAGVTVDPSNPLTVDFALSKPSTYFGGVLNLPPFNPVPKEILNYLPDSNALSQHTYADGPYEVQSYNANRSIVFVRNPVWNQASDPIRKAYVDKVDVSETGNQQGIYQQILTNTPQADMQWDVSVPPTAIPGLIADKNPGFSLQTEGTTNPYIIFNTISKNNGGALGNAVVRQAISYAISRTQLLQNRGGPLVSPPLTHLIAPGTDGAGPNFDDYPYNPAKAKAMLAAAGFPHLSLKLLYRTGSSAVEKDFETLQANMGAVGISLTGISASVADLYGKYLIPGTSAKNSVWDLAEAGWGPDWYPTGGKSYFEPILNGTSLPPISSNFGFFSDPKLNSIMASALAAPTSVAASALWHQADVEAMAQAALYPVTDPNWASIHGTQVHNCIFIGAIQNCDMANVWLTS